MSDLGIKCPKDMSLEVLAYSSRLYPQILDEVIGLDYSEDGAAGAVRSRRGRHKRHQPTDPGVNPTGLDELPRGAVTLPW